MPGGGGGRAYLAHKGLERGHGEASAGEECQERAAERLTTAADDSAMQRVQERVAFALNSECTHKERAKWGGETQHRVRVLCE